MKKLFLFVLLTQLFACTGPIHILEKDDQNKTFKCKVGLEHNVLACVSEICKNGFTNIEIEDQPIQLIRCK